MKHVLLHDTHARSSLVLVVTLALSSVLYLHDWYSELRNNLLRVSLLHGPVEAASPHALDLASHMPRMARMIGRLHLQAERPDVALYWIQHATSGPQASLAYFDLCNLYWEFQRASDAVAACRAGGIPAQVWVTRGGHARIAGDVDTAMRAYDMALALDPTLIEARLRLAELWEKLHKPDEVIRLLEPWLNHSKSSPELFRLVATAYWELGQSDRALSVLLEGNRHFPDSAVIYVFLGYVYQDRGEDDLAALWYDRYLQWEPDHVYVLDQRARIAESQEDWQLAAKLYKRAAALSPSDVGMWLGLGRSREAAGAVDAAMTAYERVLQLDPDNEHAARRIQALR